MINVYILIQLIIKGFLIYYLPRNYRQNRLTNFLLFLILISNLFLYYHTKNMNLIFVVLHNFITFGSLSFLYSEKSRLSIPFILWISICFDTFMLVDYYLLEIFFWILFSLPLLKDFKHEDSIKFSKISIMFFPLFFVLVSFYFQWMGQKEYVILSLTTAIIARQFGFPFHHIIYDDHNLKKYFPFLIFYISSQTGALLYLTLDNIFNHFLPYFEYLFSIGAILSGLYLAMLGLGTKNILSRHLTLIISQSTLVTTALVCNDEKARVATIILIISIALSASLLGFIVYNFFDQKGIFATDQFYQLFTKNKKIAAIYLLSGASLVGFPLTIGFVGEELLFHVLMEKIPFLAVGMILITILNSFNLFYMFGRLFHGHNEFFGLPIFFSRNSVKMMTLFVLIITFIGIFPNPLIKLFLNIHSLNSDFFHYK